MKVTAKIISMILAIVMIMQVFGAEQILAADNKPDRPVIIIDGDSKPITGYSKEDKYYVNLNWLPVTKAPGWDGVFYNLYIQEIDKQGKLSSYILKEGDISGTKALIRDLKPGTIYNFYIIASFKRSVDGVIYTSIQSDQSNIVTAMTDLQVFAYPYGNKQIKIEWDDVWNVGGRIGYNLYIADDSAFSNTQPIYISPSQVGQDSRITVNHTTGKLEYIHTVSDSGRVYYIKIAPEIANDEVFFNPISKTVATSSFILVKTTKMSTSDSGTVWRLNWSKVAVAFQDIKITYQLYKVSSKTNNLPQYMLSVDDNSTYITVPQEEEDSYYLIRAIVTDPLGNDIYKDWNVKIVSDKVYLVETEIPTTPASPELMDLLESAPGVPVITYEGQLKPDSATLLWKAPRKGNGEIDYDVVYDMWIIADPQKIDNPDEVSKIAENIKVGDTLVQSENDILGSKYVVNGLTPNSTYYFKIVAKKTYLEYVEDNLENVTNVSVPAMKVVITPPEGSNETPLVPGRPPLKIKKDSSGKEIITDTTTVIQLKNKWYEKFNQETGKWEYIEPVSTVQDGITVYFPNDATVSNDVYGKVYRKVEYDSGITFNVGYTEFTEGMNYNELMNSQKYPTDKITGFPTTANDPSENPINNPDGEKHNVDIILEGLDPNTAYIIWVRANRGSTGLVSGPSDPVVVTTAPGLDEIPEKPVVPFFNYSYAADTYVELGWEFKPVYKYYIKYSTNEDLSKAEGSTEVDGEELSVNNTFRISELTPETLYYFWIQAEAGSGENSIMSEWSDAYAVKTKADIPPSTPRGFGIKNTSDAVTKSSITYEWMIEDGLEYILEIASDIDYKEAIIINAGSVSELKVEGLSSNKRYYTRLYAYDPVKDLKSLPTQSIIAKTLKSRDEYDSDEDIGNVISGEYIIKDTTAPNFTWNVRITGVNADRFIERIRNDRELVYVIDLTNPPTNIKSTVLTISSKVFKTMTQLQETLVISTGSGRYTIRPGVFSTDLDERLSAEFPDFNYRIEMTAPDETPNIKVNYMTYQTPLMSVRVKALNGSNEVNLELFNTPMRYTYEYTYSDWYKDGITSGYLYEPLKKSWLVVATEGRFDTSLGAGYLSFELSYPGIFAVAEQNGRYFDDIRGHWAEASINNVDSVKELKSITARTFRPNSYVTISDTVKLMFDVLGYSYDSQYMTQAMKSALVTAADVEAQSNYCLREKAIAMAVRLYEIKTGVKAVPEYGSPVVFSDMDKVSYEQMQKVRFAVENGIAIGRTGDILGPKDNITRAELLTLLEKYLAAVGELE